MTILSISTVLRSSDGTVLVFGLGSDNNVYQWSVGAWNLYV